MPFKIITHLLKRIENLTAKLADLPRERPAEPIYKQIQAITEKLTQLENAKANLLRERRYVTANDVDKTELLFRVKRAINNLEKAPVEGRSTQTSSSLPSFIRQE